MALGILFLMFVSMSVISVLGILLMFLLKEGGMKKGIFYFMAVWGMLISAWEATSLPTNYIAQQMIAWAFGILSVIGLVVHIRAKGKQHITISYILVTVSVVAGMLKLFLF